MQSWPRVQTISWWFFALLFAFVGLGCDSDASTSSNASETSAQTGNNGARTSTGEENLPPTSGGGDGQVETGEEGGASDDGDLSDEASAPPGVMVESMDMAGSGPCDGLTLEELLTNLYEAFPDLSDIQTLYTSEIMFDGSFVFAFQAEDGAFALALKRGLGDCPSGCTEEEWFYFETDASCTPTQVGHYHPTWGENGCIEQDGEPMWGHPVSPDPIYVCDADNSPQDISGTYSFFAQGQWSVCAESAAEQEVLELALEISVEVTQDNADLSTGTVTVQGTGHPLLDGQPIAATFVRQRFEALEAYDNLPSSCPQEHQIEIRHDFEKVESEGFIDVFEFGTEDCVECKGEMTLYMGLTD
jgi:hypothetical protein